MVSRRSHILILSGALSTLTMAGGVAAVDLTARDPGAQPAPTPAYVVATAHAPVPVAHEQEAGDES